MSFAVWCVLWPRTDNLFFGSVKAIIHISSVLAKPQTENLILVRRQQWEQVFCFFLSGDWVTIKSHPWRFACSTKFPEKKKGQHDLHFFLPCNLINANICLCEVVPINNAISLQPFPPGKVSLSPACLSFASHQHHWAARQESAERARFISAATVQEQSFEIHLIKGRTIRGWYNGWWFWWI